jgi:hypothetical protein
MDLPQDIKSIGIGVIFYFLIVSSSIVTVLYRAIPSLEGDHVAGVKSSLRRFLDGFETYETAAFAFPVTNSGRERPKLSAATPFWTVI